MIQDALRKLSQRWGIDFWVAYKKKNGSWTKWYLLSEWPFDYAPNYRQVLPSELVMESDLTEPENKAIAEQINASMKEKGIGFYCSFTGNKSYHNHSFWDGLTKLAPVQRTKAKELLAEQLTGKELFTKIDKANFKPKRLILIHGCKHPKTSKQKVLFDSSEPEAINSVPQEIIETAKFIQAPNFDSSVSVVPTKCPFIDYACKNELPISVRNQNVIPNLVALTQDRQVWQACADAQKKSITEFENWAKRKPKFNCAQLRKYADSVDKSSICTAHLLGAVQ